MTNLGQRVRRKCEPTKTTRVFSTLTAIDPATGNMLPEQFHYVYDTQGRVVEATYAMTPQTWSPTNGASYYDAAHRAATRARTHYDYTARGQIKGVYNWWDTWNSGTGTYASGPIRANECVYETTGLNRGIKTQNKFYNVASGAWNLQRTETYGYDANRDFLASANYGDGHANANPVWTYDAAGNRASDSTNAGTWTYDNLNRMTASPGATYTNDILGNRLTKGTGTYTWDDLNRLTANVTSGTTSNYVYRADGLRVQKESHAGSTNSNLVRYRYDGQMGIEDVESASTNGGVSYSVSAINRFALGGRGIDAISRTTSSGTLVTYPLYDAHGNGIGSLSKSGGLWSISDERSYEAWGQVRTGGPGDQKVRYCASIGHKQDDESGLVYMRARYYDPSSARFVSEDPAKDGVNWYRYACNRPYTFVDRTGLFLDLLLAVGFEDFLEAKDYAASQAAKSWAKDKVEKITARHTGKILGHLAAETIDDLIMGGTTEGFFLRNKNGPKGTQIHFKLMDGKISFQQEGLQKGTIAYEFFQGFADAFKDGLM